MTQETKYIPTWKDSDGNRVLFPSTFNISDNYNSAHTDQINGLLIHLPFGLSIGGVLELEIAEDGTFIIPHIPGNAGQLGPCMLISGPEYDKAFKLSSIGDQKAALEIAEARGSE